MTFYISNIIQNTEHPISMTHKAYKLIYERFWLKRG
jgi:hypothetical protein